MEYSYATVSMAPSRIRFSQDSVAMCFKNGKNLNETCKEIAEGELSVNQIPSIRVVKLDGRYYSKDNRRLYIFRVLERLGILSTIKVIKVDEIRRELTTDNDGCHVVIRNQLDERRSTDYRNIWKLAIIYRHCKCEEGRNHELPEWWTDESQRRGRTARPITNLRVSSSYGTFHPESSVRKHQPYQQRHQQQHQQQQERQHIPSIETMRSFRCKNTTILCSEESDSQSEDCDKFECRIFMRPQQEKRRPQQEIRRPQQEKRRPQQEIRRPQPENRRPQQGNRLAVNPHQQPSHLRSSNFFKIWCIFAIIFVFVITIFTLVLIFKKLL